VLINGAGGGSGMYAVQLAKLRQRRRGHGPGRVALDLSVMLADGGEAIADLAVLRDQSDVFGPVASDATAWRVLSMMDKRMLARVHAARAAARRQAWAQLAASGGELPAASAAGRRIDGLVLDLDATIVVCHSEKESATPTWKQTFGYHPLRCSLDNTGEAPSGLLRKGRAGSNTTADHVLVLKQALAQIPETHRYGHEILVRTDSAGCTHGLLAYIRRLRKKGIRARFSVGVAITEPVREAIRQARDWIPAIDLDGELREGAEVCELTGLVPADGYPKGTRFIVRRERPQFLEARHRAHARLEDRTRCGKDTGFGRFPSRMFAINQAWLQLALVAIDLIAWTQHLLLDGELAKAEPKKLRYRLLHVAARITRSARQTRLRIAQNWPWADTIVAAFTRLAALPRPAF
jgi:Transposase DDE domain group 1